MSRCLVLLAAVLLAALALAPAARGIPFSERDLASEESLRALYERWRSHYHRVSPRDGDDKQQQARRFNVFKENARYVHEANRKDGRPFRLALNKFADMTTDEFRRTYAGSRTRHHRAQLGEGRSFAHAQQGRGGTTTNLPPAVDWRLRGAVTGVKDQGQCGEHG